MIANSDTNTTPNVTTGQTTRYTYDYRHRVVGQTAYPIFGTPLWTERRYINNQLFYAREPYGTRTYNNYRDFDGASADVRQGNAGARHSERFRASRISAVSMRPATTV